MGTLGVSRSFGDPEYKNVNNINYDQDFVICKPDVVIEKLDSDVEFLILACDGLWDVISNQEAVNFVRKKLDAQIDPEVIARDLCQTAIDLNSHDNVSLVLAVFRDQYKDALLKIQKLKKKNFRKRSPKIEPSILPGIYSRISSGQEDDFCVERSYTGDIGISAATSEDNNLKLSRKSGRRDVLNSPSIG
eukprot:TRINITY_DN5453_c1_g1_i4.p1 TRINITY_DN5453_c1_g1~~TRINITY_DN5453_c1_g1_i4.p1  ORF type:complete len:190 (+),score=30.86 TRINITY_DN5453_c1_g1_i4:1488-2057(+)